MCTNSTQGFYKHVKTNSYKMQFIPQPADWPAVDSMLDRVFHVETSDEAAVYICTIMNISTVSSTYERRMIILSTIELIRKYNLNTRDKFWLSLYKRMMSQIEKVPYFANYYKQGTIIF